MVAVICKWLKDCGTELRSEVSKRVIKRFTDSPSFVSGVCVSPNSHKIGWQGLQRRPEASWTIYTFHLTDLFSWQYSNLWISIFLNLTYMQTLLIPNENLGYNISERFLILIPAAGSVEKVNDINKLLDFWQMYSGCMFIPALIIKLNLYFL